MIYANKLPLVNGAVTPSEGQRSILAQLMA